MDRVTVSPGQIPLDVDILRTNQFAMVGNAKLAEAILGTGTQVDGFPLAPTSPASMSLTLGAGQVYEMENLEASPWSSLPADTHSILKQGLLLDVATLTFVAPSTTGFAQNVLVEVQYQDVDTGATVRPTTTRRTPRFNTTGRAALERPTTRRGAVRWPIRSRPALRQRLERKPRQRPTPDGSGSTSSS